MLERSARRVGRLPMAHCTAMMAIELAHDRDPSRPATDIVDRAAGYCLDEGVLVLKAGPYRNIIRVLSPLVIEDPDLERGLDVIETAVIRAVAEGSVS